MMKKKQIRTVDEYRAEVAAIVNAELDGFNAQEVRRNVREKLQSSVFDIIVNALGFSNRWGRWEIDHCNGHHNKASDTMFAEAKGAAEQWLKEQADKLPPLPAAAVKALKDEYSAQLKRNVQELLRERANSEAHGVVDELLQKEPRP